MGDLMSKAVVVVSFEAPEDLHTGHLWQKTADALRPIFAEEERVQLFIAVDDVAQQVHDIFDPPREGTNG